MNLKYHKTLQLPQLPSHFRQEILQGQTYKGGSHESQSQLQAVSQKLYQEK